MGQRHKLYGQLEVEGQMQVGGEMDVAGQMNVGGALVVTDDTTTNLPSGTTGSLVYYNLATGQLTYGGPPPALEKELRQDFVSPYSYCGKADAGASESSNVWLVTRIQILDDGTTTVTTANNVNWTNRYTHIYS
jgi:hypothetical protein